MKRSFWILCSLIMVSVVAFPASTQFSITGGYSKVTSTGNEFLSGQYYVSGLGLIRVAKGLHAGLWGAYHHWGLNESYFQEIIDYLNDYGFDFAVSGSGSNVQIFPCLRYEFVQTGTFRPYIHVGLGLSIWSAKAEIIASYEGENYSEKVDESGTRFGCNFGVGTRIFVSKSISVEALALFNLNFSEAGGTANWLSFGIGLNFGR